MYVYGKLWGHEGLCGGVRTSGNKGCPVCVRNAVGL